MNALITVREYAWLTTAAVTPSLDRAQISVSAFKYLCELSQRYAKNGVQIAYAGENNSLKLDNHVGVVQTSCGTTIEILPKHVGGAAQVRESRKILRKMIQALLDVPARTTDLAQIEIFDAPASEWVMRRFALETDSLLKRGIRSDYNTLEEETPFLRGQLNLQRQLRQAPGKAHRFHVRHDLYQPNNAENRLLRLALELVRRATSNPETWRLVHELIFCFDDVPRATNIEEDLNSWRSNRLMSHYQAVKPWCELILRQQSPHAVKGNDWGISLLFPMEKLFERFVAHSLRRQIPKNAALRAQPASQYLCEHHEKPTFRLEPDLLVEHLGARWVLDTKWKRIDEGNRAANYGLSQSDFYQMFAYGQRYLLGEGRMALIYPKSSTFTTPLRPFRFKDAFDLLVLPFDLESESILGCELLRIDEPALQS